MITDACYGFDILNTHFTKEVKIFTAAVSTLCYSVLIFNWITSQKLTCYHYCYNFFQVIVQLKEIWNSISSGMHYPQNYIC